MAVQQYETVFILTPVLSENQMKDAVEKFKKLLKDNGAEIIHDESWGLKKLSYPIMHKSTGFYHLVEFKAETSAINSLELAYRRDEKVMRFLTTRLDRHAIEYNVKRRNGEFNKKEEKAEVAS